MANRLKRLQLEAERLQEAEKYAAALRRTERTPSVPRIRKRRPERSDMVFTLRLKIFEFWDKQQVRTLDGHETPESFTGALFRSRSLLRALIQQPAYLEMLLLLFRRMRSYRAVDNWRGPRSTRPDRVIRSYILHRFVRFEWSGPLMTAWMEAPHDEKLLDQFIHMAEGKGFRRLPHLPDHFTSKMAHYTLHAPSYLHWYEVPSWAYLRGLGFPANKVRFLFDLEDLEFIADPGNRHLWYFILRHPELSLTDVHRITRFYHQQRAGGHYEMNRFFNVSIEVEPLFPEFNFSGATLASVIRRVREWEMHLQTLRNTPMAIELPPAGIRGLDYLPDHGNLPVQIFQITSPMDLFREGRAMHHCVATYLRNCQIGQCSIWVVRQANMRLATIELRSDKKIYQIKGKFNRYPDELALQAVSVWCRQEGLELLR